jgi:hypothetical protein
MAALFEKRVKSVFRINFCDEADLLEQCIHVKVPHICRRGEQEGGHSPRRSDSQTITRSQCASQWRDGRSPERKDSP